MSVASKVSPHLSVIIPVYNAQANLACCLASIQAQSYSDWECICVDDGSSDDSREILDAFATTDSRFRVVGQANKGPGMARNAGLAIARGEWFTFVDADDVIHPDLLIALLHLATSHNADLSVCGYERFRDAYASSVNGPSSSYLKYGVDVRSAPLLPRLVEWQAFRVHPWGKLYKRSVHSTLSFPPLFGPEDAYVCLDVYAASRCVVFTSAPLYGYRIVESGLTNSLFRYRNYIEGDPYVAIHCCEVCDRYGAEDSVAAAIAGPYVMRIYGYVNALCTTRECSKKEKRDAMRVALSGLLKIRRETSGRLRIVPAVHAPTYMALRLNSLVLLQAYERLKCSFVWPMRRHREGHAPG